MLSGDLCQPHPVILAQLGERLRPRRAAREHFFTTVFARWADANILPLINEGMAELQKRSPEGAYGPVSADELVRYFLASCLRQLGKHVKHSLSVNTLSDAARKLGGIRRFKAIRARFALHPHQVDAVFESWPTHLAAFLRLGSVFCVDETMFPHYGKNADQAGQLRHAPGKPYDFGMWVFVLAQRLHYSGLPVPLGFRWARTATGAAPGAAALALLAPLKPCLGPNVQLPIIVADSHWCSGSIVRELATGGYGYVIALKTNSGIVSNDLLNFAKSDLGVGRTHTYINGEYVLEVNGRDGDDAIGLITNVWKLPDLEVDSTRHCSYATAQALYNNETVESILLLCNRDPAEAQLRKEKLIFKITGWDVLRPENEQGSSAPITYEAARRWKKAHLRSWIEHVTKRNFAKSATKAEMLQFAFPGEAPDEIEVVEEEEGGARAKRGRNSAEQLEQLQARVREFYTATPHSHSIRCAVYRRQRRPSMTSTQHIAMLWIA